MGHIWLGFFVDVSSLTGLRRQLCVDFDDFCFVTSKMILDFGRDQDLGVDPGFLD